MKQSIPWLARNGDASWDTIYQAPGPKRVPCEVVVTARVLTGKGTHNFEAAPKEEGQEHESTQRDSRKRNREQAAAVSRERAAAGKEGHRGATGGEKRCYVFLYII